MRGSTLAKLHWDWRAGTTLRGALTSGRHIGLLGLACIASTFVVIDGPLLQRASTVIPAPVDKPIPLNISMAPQVPRGYTGYWQTIANLGQPNYWVASAFASTMPGSKGPVPNTILSEVSIDVQIELTKAWFYDEAPLQGYRSWLSGQVYGQIDCSRLVCLVMQVTPDPSRFQRAVEQFRRQELQTTLDAARFLH